MCGRIKTHKIPEMPAMDVVTCTVYFTLHMSGIESSYLLCAIVPRQNCSFSSTNQVNLSKRLFQKI